MSSERDPFEILRAATPFPVREDRSVEPAEAADRAALFEEITMTEVLTKKTGSLPPPIRSEQPRGWRGPRAFRGALATAVAAIAAFVAIAVVSGGGQPALATVVDAAERTAGYDSGRISVVIDVREAVTGDGQYRSSSREELEHVYDGDDFSQSREEAFLEGGGDVDSDEATERFGEAQIFVDGRLYMTDVLDGGWFELTDDLTGGGSGGSPSPLPPVEARPGFGPEQVDPEAMIELISLATDLSETSSDNGVTSYRGTVTMDQIMAIELERLPAGLYDVATDESLRHMSNDPTLTIEVADGALRSVTIALRGDITDDVELDGFYLDMSITTRYDGLGEPQDIAPPPPELVKDPPAEFGPVEITDPEQIAILEEATAVLDELEERRPGLCADVDSPDALTQCYEDAGEPQAAEAWEQIDSIVGG